MADPTLLSQRLAALSPEQRAALARKVKRNVSPSGPSRRGPGPIPLSFAQERLWFIDQLEPGNIAYNLLAQYEVPALAQHAHLQRALDLVVQRHESLRTTFALERGEPVQCVAETLAVPVEECDLRGTAHAEREYHERVGAFGRRPFDLSAGPLLRALWCRLPGQRSFLVLAMHHITSDGWSMKILLRDLTAAYTATQRGVPPDWPALPIQYPDYSAWQKQTLASGSSSASLKYWTNQLEDAPASLRLPYDWRRPDRWSFQGASLRFVVAQATSDGVRRVANDAGATPFMVLLSAFYVLLARLSGETDVLIGSSIACRLRAEVENLIGFFVNTLVLRAQVDRELPFRLLVSRVRELSLDAYAHQDLPFERLVSELRPERSLNQSPLIQATIDYQTVPAVAGARNTDEISSPVPGTTKFDFSLFLEDDGSQLGGAVEYSTALLRDSSARRWLEYYLHVLAAAVSAPDTRCADLPLTHPLPGSAGAWSSHLSATSDLAFVRALELCAARQPDHPALVSGRRELSYGALDRESSRLAARLRAHGCEAGDRVAIAGAEGPEGVIAAVSLLKLGASVVPLDAEPAARRLQMLLRDASLRAVLVRSEADAETWRELATCIVFGEPEPAGAGEPMAAVTASPDDAACILSAITTSGSRHVVFDHAALTAATSDMVDRFGLRADLRCLQLHGLTSGHGLFAALAVLRAGATLCFAPRDARDSAAQLTAFLNEAQVSWAALSLAELAGMRASDLPGLQTIVVHAAPSAGTLLEPWSIDREVFLAYGPLQACGIAASKLCVADARSLTMGSALPRVTLTVLDARQRLVPPGVPGDLHVCGAGVARGYIPSAPDDDFVQLPSPLGRAHRTGVRAWWNEQDELVLLEADADALFVHGHRVEVEAVRACLARDPEVADAAVLVTGEDSPDPQLHAYVVARSPGVLDTALLGQRLSATLPAYARPGSIQALASLPRTRRGQIDRAQLARVHAHMTAPAGGAHVAPRSTLERTLTELWVELLGDPSIGVHDDFFERGGNSLLATLLASRVRERLDLEVPVRVLFQARTVAELAAELERSNYRIQDAPTAGPEPEAQLSEHVDRMSEREVDDLLDVMLEQKGTGP